MILWEIETEIHKGFIVDIPPWNFITILKIHLDIHLVTQRGIIIFDDCIPFCRSIKAL